MKLIHGYSVGDIIRIKENHGGQYVGATGRVIASPTGPEDEEQYDLWWVPITSDPRLDPDHYVTRHPKWRTGISFVELLKPAEPPKPYSTNTLGDFPKKESDNESQTQR